MKASEFVTEGPIAKAGDWLEKQAHGRIAKDKANALKRKLPGLTKNIQEVMAARLNKIQQHPQLGAKDKAEKTLQLPVAMLEKALKADVKSDDYDHDIGILQNIARSSPETFATDGRVKESISNIIKMSFEEKWAKEAGAEEERDTAGEIPKNFKAEVYDLPDYHDRSDMVYVNNDGEWSLWKKSSRNVLNFQNNIDGKDVDAVLALIRDVGQDPRFMSFVKQKGDYYSISTRMA